MNAEQVPVDDLYESGIDFPVDETTSGISASVNWAAADTAAADHAATAVRLHYSSLGQLMVCGELLTGDVVTPDVQCKQLAARLAQYKTQQVQLWGRYLAETAVTAASVSTFRQYFVELFDADAAAVRIVGIDLLGGVGEEHLLEQATRTDPAPLFEDVVAAVREHREAEQDLIRDHLTTLLDREQVTRQTIADAVGRFRPHLEDITLGRDTVEGDRQGLYRAITEHVPVSVDLPQVPTTESR